MERLPLGLDELVRSCCGMQPLRPWIRRILRTCLGGVRHEIPQWGFLSPQKLLAVGIAIVFAYVNFRGASETGKIGNFVTMAKIVILAIFMGFGLELMFRRGNWSDAFIPFMPNGWGGVFQAMGLTFIAFQGFEVISQCSEEVKNPKKNIPRAVFLSLLIVVPIYLLVAVTSLGSVRPEGGMTPWDFLAAQKEIALVGVAQCSSRRWGDVADRRTHLDNVCSECDSLFVLARCVCHGQGQELPHVLQQGPRKEVHAALCDRLLVLHCRPHVHLAAHRRRCICGRYHVPAAVSPGQYHTDTPSQKTTRPGPRVLYPLFPYLTIAGIALLLFLAVYMFNYSPLGWFVTAGWIGIGLIMYQLYASTREVEHVRKVKAFERLERKEFTILVPLSNPESADSQLT